MSDGAKEASYLDLIEKLKTNGTVFKTQSMELFRRIVFNVLVGNTDDHAFFITPRGAIRTNSCL